jgi:hypothetical protein
MNDCRSGMSSAASLFHIAVASARLLRRSVGSRASHTHGDMNRPMPGRCSMRGDANAFQLGLVADTGMHEQLGCMDRTQ